MITDKEFLIKILHDSKQNLEDKLIVLWGIGNTAKLYQKNIDILEREGLNIAYYTVSNPDYWGKMFAGKPIISPYKLKELDSVFVIILSMNPKMTYEIKLQLKDIGIEGIPIDKVMFSRHSGKVIECFDMLEDAESKRVYAGLIKARIDVVNPPQDLVTSDQYYSLPQFSAEDESEVLVEAGAYIGNTLEAYVRKKHGKFKKIISFEPDPDNVRKAQETIEKITEEFHLEKNQIELHPYAVGDREEKVLIERSQTNQGQLTRVIPAAENIMDAQCTKTIVLDDFLTLPYSFLKADVEGYEQNVLLGAEKGIQRYKPLLAICIYHSAADFYEIPLLIKKILPEYRLAIRHHLNTLSETVVYAYTEK